MKHLIQQIDLKEPKSRREITWEKLSPRYAAFCASREDIHIDLSACFYANEFGGLR